jgi:hypothetical protein
MGFDFAGGSFYCMSQGMDGAASKARVCMKKDDTHSRGQGLVEFALIMRTGVTYNFPVIIAGFIPGLPTDYILLSTSTTMRRE